MATYNFTIRATDTAGAFADRTFSINVNNTTLDRFVVVGSNGLARSVDGVTWKTEPGRSGTGVVYGNGRWVVYNASDSATTKTIHTSPDGVNWSTLSLVSSASTGAFDLPSLKTGGQGFSCVKYLNNRWVAFTYNNFNTQGSAATQCYESQNLQSWTVRGDVQTNSAAQSGFSAGITDVVYGNGMYIAVGGYMSSASLYGKAIYTSTDLITWTRRVLVENGNNTTGGSSILNVNGLFIATLFGGNGTSGYTLTSPDGTTWTPRTHVINSTGLVYVNGRILNQGGTSLYRSLDAGQTWTSTATGLVAPTLQMASLLNGCTLASYGNTVISANTKASVTGTVYRFNAEGVSTGSTALDATNVGTVRGVAARP